jgi:predicted DNA-binding transcriptional regulator AlpA
MDNEITNVLTKNVVANLKQYFEEGPDHEIITQRTELAEFLTGMRRADVSKYLALEGFPQIRDATGKVIGWSWRAIRKWEMENDIKSQDQVKGR